MVPEMSVRNINMLHSGVKAMLAALLALLSISVMAVPCIAASGALDPTFGTGGFVRYENPVDYTSNEEAAAVAVQSDGKIVMAGFIGNSFDVLLLRYNTDGTPDTTFSQNGIVTYDSPVHGQDEAFAMVIQPDGKILVAGTNGQYVLILRYKSDGTLDDTFGVGGAVVTGIEVDAQANAIALQPDGKIVVAGTTSNQWDSYAFVARYTSKGVLDGTFGVGGIVKFNGSGGGWDNAYGVAVQSDGKIVVTGSTSKSESLAIPDTLLLRYNANGSLDTSFGESGVVTFTRFSHSSGRGVAIQPDGKIVVVGGGNDVGALTLRYNSNGSPDAGFGTDGAAISYPGGWGLALLLQPDGKIVCAGRFNSYALVWRLNSDGALDASFGQNGVGLYNDHDYSVARSLAMQSDGNIVVAGYCTFHDNYSDNAVLLFRIIVEKTEQWELIFNGGQGSGNSALSKGQNGTVTADGNWTYNYQGANVSGPYSNAPVTIAGASISITSSGTATNPSVPSPNQTSLFTSKISGRACNGHGSGTFEITFSNPLWPPSIKGTWTGTRKSGRGITAIAMPWIPQLMLND